MKRKAWMAAAVAACALGSAPTASASLLNGDPFGSVSATNAAYGPTAKANVLTALSAQRDNVTGAVSGTLTMTGTDTKARSIDATVDCLSIDLNDAGVLAHVTRAENEPVGLYGVFLALTDPETDPGSEVGSGDKIAVTTFNQRQYQRQQLAGCTHAPGKAALTAGNITITIGLGLAFPPCFPFCATGAPGGIRVN